MLIDYATINRLGPTGQGVYYALQSVRDMLYWAMMPKTCRWRIFRFQNRNYEYFVHPYNRTWLNERCVEIPIAMKAVMRAMENGRRVLEVGNVLRHYYPVLNHDVIDKYERGYQVENVDIQDFESVEKYDLIVSISTIEHIAGTGCCRAVNAMRKALAENGRAIVTWCNGYSAALDALKGKLFDNVHGMKKTGDNWIQLSPAVVDESRVFVGTINAA